MSSVACKPFIAVYRAVIPWMMSEYTTTFFFGLWVGYFIMKPHWATLGGLLLLGAPLAIHEHIQRKKRINSD
jgi:hypothetical protein